MQQRILVAAALLLVVASVAMATSANKHVHNHQDPKVAAAAMRFGLWKSQHRPAGYATAEAESRAFEAFQETEIRVEMKNRRAKLVNSTAVYTAFGPFADMHPADFQAKYLMPRRSAPSPAHKAKVGVREPKKDVAVPSAIDWRTKGAVTAVKNQEQCGSCWAFSATEEIESQWILAGKGTNTTVNLAPQQIVDCDTTSAGCNGGETESAFDYVINAGGLESESAYPYQGQDGTCAQNSASYAAKISSYKYATSDYDETTLQKNLISWGPISVCLDASSWQDYQSGVMTWTECAWINLLDHCVQLVGYDSTLGTQGAWWVRNSWTTQWGINGYIQLEMWEDTCGIAHDATSVTI